MSRHIEKLRILLASGPQSAQQLTERLGISQPTLSRALSRLGDEVVRLGAARSMQYTLRNTTQSVTDIPVYRVNPEGQIRSLGTLIAVRPNGFVMRQADGITVYSDSLPWWLFDMCPQGFLGRAYAARHGAALGLPARLSEWNDDHILRALLAHGHDVVGNLLLGDLARERFLTTPPPMAVTEAQKAKVYRQLALDAANGEVAGSSAGGEQPKFAVYAATPEGPRHLLVKFSEQEDSPVSERWRDLMLAEHLALETLRTAGIPAAQTYVLDYNGQRFLEVERFDRLGSMGRRALHSLTTLDAEFVGAGTGSWPLISRSLVNTGQIQPEAIEHAAMMWAFGTLIGNTDMHNGNLSFIAEHTALAMTPPTPSLRDANGDVAIQNSRNHGSPQPYGPRDDKCVDRHGRPYAIAPAYDMTTMAFAPRSGGGLPESIPAPTLRAEVPNYTWRRAEILASEFLGRMRISNGFSPRFSACIAALEKHLYAASAAITRLE